MSNLFFAPRVLPTVTIQTLQGVAVLTLRPLDADNHAWWGERLDDELREKAADVAPPRTEEDVRAARVVEAERLHRWCFVSLTVGGVDRAADSLEFMRELVLTDYIRVLKILGTAPAKEASPDAIAGE